MDLRKLTCIFAVILSTQTHRAPAQPVRISNFALFENEKTVILSWSLDSGATCNGIEILRGLDTANFIKVGEIPGVCGSSSSVTSYTFTDCCPELNRTNYYRLKLGFSQYSEIRAIYLDYVKSGTVLIKTGPGTLTFRFKNHQNDLYRLRIFNQHGCEVFKAENLAGEEVTVDQHDFPNGSYSYRLEGEGNLYKGKIVLAR